MKRANQQTLKESSSDSYSLEFWVNPVLNHSICVGHEINRIKNSKNKKKHLRNVVFKILSTD